MREEFHTQTATINWRELQPHYARGALVMVDRELDLVEVALQLRLDNKSQFEQWMTDGVVAGVEDELAQRLFEEDPAVWAVVVPPWLLVQERSE